MFDNFEENPEGSPELELVDQSEIQQVAQLEHSLEFDKIQKHLMLKIGSSARKTDMIADQHMVHTNQENVIIDGIEVEPSARIEHGGVDGSIDFRF